MGKKGGKERTRGCAEGRREGGGKASAGGDHPLLGTAEVRNCWAKRE